MIINNKIATSREIAGEYETEHQIYYESGQTLKEFKIVCDNLWINYDYLIEYLNTQCCCQDGNDGFCLICHIRNHLRSIAKLHGDTKNV